MIGFNTFSNASGLACFAVSAQSSTRRFADGMAEFRGWAQHTGE